MNKLIAIMLGLHLMEEAFSLAKGESKFKSSNENLKIIIALITSLTGGVLVVKAFWGIL